MTDAISGMEGSFWICATADGLYEKLAEVSELRLKLSGKPIDTSNVDDEGWGSEIAGARTWEISAKNNLILTDSAYAIIEDAMISGEDIFVKALSEGTPTVNPKGFTGKATVQGADLLLASTTAQQSASWTIKGRGALTKITP
jgi:predicted secreted protein